MSKRENQVNSQSTSTKLIKATITATHVPALTSVAVAFKKAASDV